ncbi:MAG: hypothetical protein ACRCZD_14605, partial [Phycicoccus sp.]
MTATARGTRSTSYSIGCALVAAVLIPVGLCSAVASPAAAAVDASAVAAVMASTPPDDGGGFAEPGVTNDAAVVRAEQDKERAVKNANSRGGGVASPAKVDPYEYRLSIACGGRRAVSPDGSDDSGNCQWALTACQFRDPPSDGPLYI